MRRLQVPLRWLLFLWLDPLRLVKSISAFLAPIHPSRSSLVRLSAEWKPSELIQTDNDQNNDDDEWLPDGQRARQRSVQKRIYAERVPTTKNVDGASTRNSVNNEKPPPSPYTDEEESVIAAMGGKSKHPNRKRREDGYLGDSTLSEICTDYSVPICYLADVLCTWGVPVPINFHDKLGDLVSGEQAFALLEAINTLDVGALHDRYADANLEQLCFEYNIDMKDAFALIMKEGWNLPFGVQTCLRVEQEEELIRLLGDFTSYDEDEDDDDEEF